MPTLKRILCILLLLTCIRINIPSATSRPAIQKYANARLQTRKSLGLNEVSLVRKKRQFDLTVMADHDDKEDETEIALEAIANLWRSSDGNTQIEGSAKVIHHANSLQSGNTKYQARLHIHHDYKKK